MDAVVESMGNVALGAAAPDALPAASAGGDEAPHRGAEAAAEAGARSGRSSGGRGDGREAAEGRGERRGDERHKQEQRGGRSGGGSGVGDKPAPKDFEWGDEIGEGAFSKVVRATHRESRVVYAVKVVEKALVVRENKVKYVTIERDVLNRCRHPNVVRLYCTFQDATRLHFVMELCTGELFALLSQLGTFGMPCARFWAAEVADALRYIHSCKVLHRDLKPENLLLSCRGHIKVTDFGSAKVVSDESSAGRTKSFCGTAEYVSPEVLENFGACQASDVWALGCLVFQFFAGTVPFRGGTEYLTFQKILALEYDFPDTFPEHAQAFVKSILVIDPAARLGAGTDGKMPDYRALMAHPFFEGISWTDPPLYNQRPPRPSVHLPKEGVEIGAGDDDWASDASGHESD